MIIHSRGISSSLLNLRSRIISNHEPEVKEDSHKWHEVETESAEKKSKCLLDNSKNMDAERCFFSRIHISELGYLEFLILDLGHPVFYQRVVVKPRNISNCCKRNVLHYDTQNIWHTWKDNHDINLNYKGDECLHEADEKGWVSICEIIVVVYDVLHDCDACSNIFFNINVHHHGGDEPGYHHVQSFCWSNGKGIFSIGPKSVLPDTKDHDALDKNDN